MRSFGEGLSQYLVGVHNPFPEWYCLSPLSPTSFHLRKIRGGWTWDMEGCGAGHLDTSVQSMSPGQVKQLVSGSQYPHFFEASTPLRLLSHGGRR